MSIHGLSNKRNSLYNHTLELKLKLTQKIKKNKKNNKPLNNIR
jgi:hypothetical protein